MKQLSLIRPKQLSKMIGQEELVGYIRKQVKKRVPKAWLFYGPRGNGKTSLAYILAVALQCPHNVKFGECIDCYKKFIPGRPVDPIYDHNCARYTTREALLELVEGSEYELLGEGKHKIFILDETHMLSKHAQALLLERLEAKNNPTVWILCSTDPKNILSTVRRRCQTYALASLNSENIGKTVQHYLRLAKSDLEPDVLTEALIDKGIRNPGLIAQAVEKYTAGNPPEKAADVEGSIDVDTKALCRAVTQGDLNDAWKILRECQDSDARGLRAAIVGYLKAIMLDTTEFNDRNKAVAKAIKILCGYSGAEDLLQMSALTAEVYEVCKIFSNYKR